MKKLSISEADLSLKIKYEKNIWLQTDIENGVSLMDHLYARLDAMYPLRWRSAHPTEMSLSCWRHTWAEAFEEERILPHQVKSGITECRKMYDWPPSLTEFLKACRVTVPVMHRNFPKGNKITKKGMKEGLERLQIVKEKLFANL